MSGSNSFGPASSAPADASAAMLHPLDLAVHSMPAAALDPAARRTASGRMKMLLVLLVCTAPVVASYLAYFVIRPSARSNYGELIEPQRPIPATLALAELDGARFDPARLQGQWLIVVVAGGACDVRCERLLWLQRQLRETLGRDKDRLDKIWLVDDAVSPRPETLQAIGIGTPAQVLRVPRGAQHGRRIAAAHRGQRGGARRRRIVEIGRAHV